MAVPSEHRTGLMLLLGATLAWSSAGLFARAIPLDTPTVILWRGLFGAAGLIGLLLILKGWRGLADFGRLGWVGLLYALASGLGMLTFVGALKATTIAHVAIIYATIPFAAAALGWLVLRERPSRAALITSAVALVGAATMVGLGGEGHLSGDLMAVAMVICMAVIVVIARARPRLPTLAAGALSSIWAPLTCLPFASMEGITAGNITLLAGFGLINTSLGFGLFIAGSRHLPAVTTALIGALETPLTPLWVWLVFGETPSPPTLIGGAVVFAAVLWFIRHESRPPLPLDKMVAMPAPRAETQAGEDTP
jgi:drug/metabolite transporter (DMT)-like permease